MKTCRFCNNVVGDEAMFCNNCGQKLEEAAQPVYEQPVYEQPQPAYTQPQQAYYQPQYQQPTESYFDGKLLQLIGWQILASLLTVCTCGLGFPWAYCLLLNWETKHTVINGRRLAFDGTGGQLIGKWIVWVLLTIITFGIYSFWLGIKLKQWKVKHTHFVN